MASNANLTTVYYLLFARYATTHIISDYPEKFKMSVMSTIFKYGPTWAKRLQIQEKVREMTDDEILKGDIAIYNNAMNPDGPPTTTTWEALKGINSQNVTLRQRGQLEAYALVDTLLRTDVTNEFIEKFNKLFDHVASPGKKLEYDLSHIAQLQAMDLSNVTGDILEPLYGSYITEDFMHIFPTVADFIDYYKTCGIPTTIPVS